ncbi:YkgJ family cysteine cluster protein [Aquitalea magnusonii]|uniref:YkgJ family cysteine cluster protein n=1 Tax=Aquitalea magnusonii TaxID=332411 RepID=UPI00142E5D6A|nr:YkgJ family cysteine cluster protein [Aquitalea magnusonii]
MKKFKTTTNGLPDIPQELIENAKKLDIFLQNSPNNPLNKLKSIYSYLDEYNQFVRTFTKCSSGCSHCCKHDVSITQLEARFIEENYTQLSLVIPKSSSYGNKGSCPFLSNTGTCKIYSHRPLNCRTLHTIDSPKLCATNKSHKLYGAVGGRAGILKYIEMAVKSLNEIDKGTSGDIRDFFPGTPIINPIENTASKIKIFWKKIFS